MPNERTLIFLLQDFLTNRAVDSCHILPALDDPNAIQVAVSKVAQGLVDGTLDEKRATRLAYVLQLAMSNVGRVNFEPEEIEEEV